MDAAIAGLCAILARNPGSVSLPPGVVCPPTAVSAAPARSGAADALARALSAPPARDAMARVAYAEAGNQGDSGLAAVVYAILNRLADGRWGTSVESVVNARGQFEPVMRAGGDWRGLPPVSAAQQARIDTILNLAIDGRLPDLTNGARYFQNPEIVARRARLGEVSPRLVNFGGATPSAVIGGHTFYADPGRGGGAGAAAGRGPSLRANDSMFVGANHTDIAVEASDPPPSAPGGTPASAPHAGDPAQALFVGRDGLVSDGRP